MISGLDTITEIGIGGLNTITEIGIGTTDGSQREAILSKSLWDSACVAASIELVVSNEQCSHSNGTDNGSFSENSSGTSFLIDSNSCSSETDNALWVQKLNRIRLWAMDYSLKLIVYRSQTVDCKCLNLSSPVNLKLARKTLSLFKFKLQSFAKD